MIYKKTLALLLVFMCTISCSNDDDTEEDPKQDLLEGLWFQVNKCQSQNNLFLNDNGTYIWKESQNIDCENNMYPTFQSEGTYIVNSNEIDFNRESSQTIDSGNTNPDTILLTFLSSEIIELTEDTFVLDVVYFPIEQGAPNITITFEFER